jgi:hypothetical protein
MKNKIILVKIFAILAIIGLIFTACDNGNGDKCANGHTWSGDVDTPPTCETAGYTTQTCLECEETQQINSTQATGHTWSNHVVTPPTCGVDGFTTQTCSECDDTRQINPTSATGLHTWGNDVVTPPTCGAAGYTTQTCSVCSKTQQINPTQATGLHTWGGDVVTPPTCGAAGYTTQTCSVCSETQQTNPTAATGLHTWGEWTISTYPTTINPLNGEETGTCTDCGETEIRALTAAAFQTYFYGTWSLTNNNNVTITVFLDENNFKLDDTEGDFQYFTINTWNLENNTTPGTMGDHPVGYRLDGTTTENQWWPSVTTVRVYLNSNGQSIARSSLQFNTSSNATSVMNKVN